MLRTVLVVCLCFLVGCGRDSTATIEARRVAPAASLPVIVGATSDQRFGPSRQPGSSTQKASESLVYELPPGWKALPAKEPRLFNLEVAGAQNCNAYLVMLPGAGGGLEANIERWQQQMGSEAEPAAEVVERRQVLLLGGQATLVVIDGHYRGMGEADLADARMVGAILPAPQFTLFAKMTGPRALVESETPAFEAWCASLALSPELQPKPVASLPGASSGGAGGGPGFTWDAPEGWRDLGPRSMRLASFAVGEHCECSISTAGGSPEANADRWLGQMGAGPLGAEGFGALARMSTGLGEAVLVQADGDWRGMSGETIEDARLVGAILPLPRTNVFVKLWGPRDEVAAAQEDFEQLTRSLRMGGR